MSNVNTKLKDFYDSGYNDAIEQSVSFLEAIEARFGNISMEKGLTLGQFIVIMKTEMSEFKHTTKDQTNVN